jgi:hypothetical protein
MPDHGWSRPGGQCEGRVVRRITPRADLVRLRHLSGPMMSGRRGPVPLNCADPDSTWRAMSPAESCRLGACGRSGSSGIPIVARWPGCATPRTAQLCARHHGCAQCILHRTLRASSRRTGCCDHHEGQALWTVTRSIVVQQWTNPTRSLRYLQCSLYQASIPRLITLP